MFKSLNRFELVHLRSENINIVYKFQLLLKEKWATRTDKSVSHPKGYDNEYGLSHITQISPDD